MRRWTLVLAAALASLWLLGGVALAAEVNGKSETKTAGTFQVELTTPAEGIKVGDAELAVLLRDRATGQAVVRESLRLELLMDAADTSMNHGDMSKQTPTAVELAADKANPGRYLGKASFTDSGDWLVRVFADTRSGQAPVAFKVGVTGGGPNWLVIGGILAVIAAAVGGTVTMVRRKSVATPVASRSLEANEA
ncbi:MAG: FixH family protein [Chloroflexota bacterium]